MHVLECTQRQGCGKASGRVWVSAATFLPTNLAACAASLGVTLIVTASERGPEPHSDAPSGCSVGCTSAVAEGLPALSCWSLLLGAQSSNSPTYHKSTKQT